MRVNPLVPLRTLVPVVCEKCDFDSAHVVLLRDGASRRELPLDKSLSELDIKELYVHDRSLGTVEIWILLRKLRQMFLLVEVAVLFFF